MFRHIIFQKIFNRFYSTFLYSFSLFLLLLLNSQVVKSQSRSHSASEILDKRYVYVADSLKGLIAREMKANNIPSLAVALVDDQKVVWASAFGYSDSDKKIPATTKTVYRIGSVSKLFTDIAIMQMTESAALDIDAPITEYLPKFRPENPFETKITLRQLMSHRSGLIREPPVGNYFDPTSPSLYETVMSLNNTKLVIEPESGIKYSNAAIAVTGYVLEKLYMKPFEEILKEAVLEPLGMSSSSFTQKDEYGQRLAEGIMWTIDGKEFLAPTFELGESPAGSMYSTVEDLGKFISALLNGGKGQNGRILNKESLENMWKPQFIEDNNWKYEIGLGFSLQSDYLGRKRVRHGGAVYGFSTELSVLPEDKVGIVVISSKGSVNDINRNIADAAMKMIISSREDTPLPEIKPANMSNRRLIDAVETLSESTAKSSSNEGFGGLTGDYGWDHNILSVYEHEGNLYVHIEYFYIYKLTQMAENEFKFGKSSLYSYEDVVFTRDASGKATSVSIGGNDAVIFHRRQ